jgi:pimeloyl-ACP methyl ester carboxylesterase
MLNETIALAKRGNGLLLWESRACKGQAISLGYSEMLDIGDVLKFVKNTPAIQAKTSKIALHGFSAGGAAATLAAARYPEVDALLTEGGYHRWDAVTGLSYGSGWLEWLIGVGGNLAYRVTTGQAATVLDPLSAIPQIVPRPIYFVYGEREASLDGARQQLAAALEKQPDTFAVLWVVPRADHSTYVADAGDEYATRTGLFYDCALRNQGCEEFWKLAGRAP